MSAAENKQMMQRIFDELAKGNSAPFIESLAEDVKWKVTGKTRWSKTYSGKRAVLTELLGTLREQLAEQYSAQADRIIAEDDLVVVEAHGQVTTKSGKPYNNFYCFVYRIEDGKVKELTEYLDTELVTKTFG